MKKKLQLNKETMAVLNMSEMSKVVGQAGVVCPDVGDDLFPHEEDCSLFYICNNGTPVLVSCPDGLQFNWELGICDFPEVTGCIFPSQLTMASGCGDCTNRTNCEVLINICFDF